MSTFPPSGTPTTEIPKINEAVSGNRTPSITWSPITEEVLSGNDLILSQLPPDVIIRIAEQLTYNEIARLCRVSRVFRDLLSRNPSFWRFLYHRDISTQRLHLEEYRYSYREAVRRMKFESLNNQLKEAARWGYDVWVKKLLDQGANSYDYSMANAAMGGHYDIVKMMLDRGADAYEWALAVAFLNRHPEIIDLIERYRRK